MCQWVQISHLTCTLFFSTVISCHLFLVMVTRHPMCSTGLLFQYLVPEVSGGTHNCPIFEWPWSIHLKTNKSYGLPTLITPIHGSGFDQFKWRGKKEYTFFGWKLSHPQNSVSHILIPNLAILFFKMISSA